jgi:hypothetical protein
MKDGAEIYKRLLMDYLSLFIATIFSRAGLIEE